MPTRDLCRRTPHAGWALWVALVVAASTPRLLPRLLAWSHAVVTVVVVVGTGNHWTLGVVVGWALVALVGKVAEPPTSDELVSLA